MASYAFFTTAQAGAIEAAASRIFPSDEVGPGATEAGVVDYIDRALAGHDRDLAALYANGIAALDGAARERGAPAFAEALPATQDAILTMFEGGENARFFSALLAHTREGLFADPVHGGNRNAVGWRLLGYPGVQMRHGPEDYAPNRLIVHPMRTLADFLAERAAPEE